jgi:predicted ATPase
MLDQLNLRFFKCFERLDLPLAPLTLLSGANASGKSSALQALVLLHQTMREHEWSTRLMLNGGSVQLGTVLDVVDKVHGRRQLEVGLGAGSSYIHWTFHGDREEMSMAVERLRLEGKEAVAPRALRHLLPPNLYDHGSWVTTRLRDLTYITAERVGPREVYVLEDRQAAPVVGARGEHTLSVLHKIRAEPIRAALLITDVPPTGLKQIEARMGGFFPGCRLDIQLIPQANAVTLGIRTSDDTDFHRPVNVGFGLTQVLPIVVAGLAAQQDDILLIENPEVHLHPRGQARMGAFLAELAASGVQVMVETHSDHVLNGIRRAVKGRVLPPEQACLHFFRERVGDLDQVVSPILDAAGNIDAWPEGFFDQYDKDMNHFAGWGD